jgi:hypothetical protein
LASKFAVPFRSSDASSLSIPLNSQDTYHGCSKEGLRQLLQSFELELCRNLKYASTLNQREDVVFYQFKTLLSMVCVVMRRQELQNAPAKAWRRAKSRKGVRFLRGES